MTEVVTCSSVHVLKEEKHLYYYLRHFSGPKLTHSPTTERHDYVYIDLVEI